MSTLLLRLMGPMQSWGTQSVAGDRDTDSWPSKSGVIGLVCAALGRPRSEGIEDLASLRFGVRVDRCGVAETDFHTAGGGVYPTGQSGVPTADGSGSDTVVSRRHFLADAAFLAGLESDDAALLMDLHAKLANPAWPLFLGRKSFVPSPPVYMADGLVAVPLEPALKSFPPVDERCDAQMLVVVECGPEEGVPRLDGPVSYELAQRRFRLRHLRWYHIEPPKGEPRDVLV
jgi:CRISPR system Cascade subunit CasD